MPMKIMFDTDNAAFADAPQAEIVEILLKISRLLLQGSAGGPIHDSNGNHIGKWFFDRGDEARAE